ncbi:hypothetical protein [Tenacibaculum finnmarkense]|uniref:hypothetical protein n=1 Tax=Tenacibaculum finnmarkense TaxID=2781243 RepID=UPI000C7C78AF|nr:hypothetical protein [Tenacibaculum finnmarkense]MCD8440274.1 hypothetical protein [Tenacibaculum finnmarkense genomovar ulcerans]MCG8721104.1 hypothetical protein [Tenacibaculum finnmarkense]
MAYKILYIDDLETDSRKNDLKNLGYFVNLYDPSPNLNDLFKEIDSDTDAVVLDYRLTKGKKNACFDAPTIAQTLRTNHKDDKNGIPLILMSNEEIKVNEFDKDFTSQDLFDFALTKEDFTRDKVNFKKKLNSFILAYQKIKVESTLIKILGLNDNQITLHSRFVSAFKITSNNQLQVSSLIYNDLLCSIGLTIGEDVLSARLGISLGSNDWKHVLASLKEAKYTGIFSDIKNRWWMDEVNKWWNDTITSETSMRRLNAIERVELLKIKLDLKNLTPLTKTKYSVSSNFWTVCKFSKKPLDPFDGIELLNNYLPWQEKEYISIDSALEKMDDYKNFISNIDKKAIRELLKKDPKNG